jgi:hypothetical protein
MTQDQTLVARLPVAKLATRATLLVLQLNVQSVTIN